MKEWKGYLSCYDYAKAKLLQVTKGLISKQSLWADILEIKAPEDWEDQEKLLKIQRLRNSMFPNTEDFQKPAEPFFLGETDGFHFNWMLCRLTSGKDQTPTFTISKEQREERGIEEKSDFLGSRLREMLAFHIGGLQK